MCVCVCVCLCVCVWVCVSESSWTVNVAEVSSSLPYSECCGGLRPLLCVWPHACLLASGGTSSSEGGRTGFYLGFVGRKDLVVDCVVPRPDTLAFGCTEWLWHLLEVGPHRTTPRSCSGCIGRAPGPPRSPGPSFTLRVFVNRCAGLLPLSAVYPLMPPKKVCACRSLRATFPL